MDSITFCSQACSRPKLKEHLKHRQVDVGLNREMDKRQKLVC